MTTLLERLADKLMEATVSKSGGEVLIDCDDPDVAVEIFDMIGEVLMHAPVKARGLE